MTLPSIGFIGLGQMGSGMAQNLVRADYALTVFDLRPEARATVTALGAAEAASIAEVVQRSDVIMTSVPSFDIAAGIAQNEILPHVRERQIVIEMSTIRADQARALGALFAAKGIHYLEAPVSGGPMGARDGNLHVFVGGDETVAHQCWPIFEVIGNPERVVYFGPNGNGQMVKMINQLAMGLSSAINLEVLSLAVQNDIDLMAISHGIGDPDNLLGWRGELSYIAGKVQSGEAEGMNVKFNQLEEFLTEARTLGLTLPLTEALFAFMDQGERITHEESDPVPSLWHELMKKD